MWFTLLLILKQAADHELVFSDEDWAIIAPPPIWVMIQTGSYINSQNISSRIGMILNMSYISFSQS